MTQVAQNIIFLMDCEFTDDTYELILLLLSSLKTYRPDSKLNILWFI